MMMCQVGVRAETFGIWVAGASGERCRNWLGTKHRGSSDNGRSGLRWSVQKAQGDGFCCPFTCTDLDGVGSG
jgi:hypothetical protein